MAYGGEPVFLSDFETIKTKGGEGKGMENEKEGFLTIHMVPPSIATLFLKGLIMINLTLLKLNEQEEKKKTANCVAIVSVL